MTARMTGAPEWTCNICGTRSTWGRRWAHYGSIRIEEDCGCMVITCSDACRRAADAAIRRFEANHPTGGKCHA